jgi:hypothetical protein
MNTLSRWPLTAAVAALALGAGIASPSARADDTEVFFTPVESSGDGTTAAGAPNILFILDSSESMAQPVESSTSYEWSAEEDWIALAREATWTGCTGRPPR